MRSPLSRKLRAPASGHSRWTVILGHAARTVSLTHSVLHALQPFSISPLSRQAVPCLSRTLYSNKPRFEAMSFRVQSVRSHGSCEIGHRLLWERLLVATSVYHRPPTNTARIPRTPLLLSKPRAESIHLVRHCVGVDNVARLMRITLMIAHRFAPLPPKQCSRTTRLNNTSRLAVPDAGLAQDFHCDVIVHERMSK